MSASTSRQPRYQGCFVCGAANPIGLNLTFWQDGETVWTEFTPDERHQGYPGIVHGGLLYAILDEVTGRAAYLRASWVVTARAEVRYLQPARLGEALRFTGRIVSERSRALELAGEARRADDNALVATLRGLFVRLPDARIRELEEIIRFED
ncbi:MAG: PaaI family thioesterase [Chloroflexota bacterium]|nr:PaaI family thioesterase [Dehalococcoidia bacterium]MDW8254544.1 PaaI family thioesterase [Chloroflexota bacterium]